MSLPIDYATIIFFTGAISCLAGLVFGLLAKDYYISAKHKAKEDANMQQTKKYYASKGLQSYYEGR
jgi:cytosine/uracil/thiamine/allantoin permease